MRLIDTEWRELPAIKRDILVAVAVDGPATGVEIHERVRGEGDVRPRMYSHLKDLREKGYLKVGESEDRRERRHGLSMDGEQLIKRGVLEPAGQVEAHAWA